MSDTDQLQAIGQQLTLVLVNAYNINDPGSNFVFLPGGRPVPDDIVQSGMGNTTQLQTWLAMNLITHLWSPRATRLSWNETMAMALLARSTPWQ